jgi:PAS domain S-box-containing protein
MLTRKPTAQNPFTLTFTDRALEAEFRATDQEKSLAQLRLDLLVGVFLYALFGIHDYWAIPEICQFAWLVRFTIVCPTLIGIYALTHTRSFGKIQQPCIFLGGFAAAGGLIMMIVKASPPGNYTYYAGLLLILLFFFRQRFVTTSALSWSVVILYEVVAIGGAAIPAQVLFSNTFVLGTFALTGMYMSYTLEQHVRTGFLMGRTIQERNHAIASTNLALKKEVKERRQAECVIQDQMEFLRTLLDTIPNPIFYRDFQGHQEGCNRAYEQFFDRQWRQRKTTSLVDPHLADIIKSSNAQRMHTGTAAGILTQEAMLKHADGTNRTTLFSQATYTDRSGKPAGIVGVVLDITDLKLIEAENLRLESQLFQSQKIEALGQLAGGIAHEFNNILTAIIGYAHLLQKNIEENDPRRLFVDNTITSGERAARLIRDILAFGRKQKIDPRRVDINNVIREAQPLLRMMLGEDIELQLPLQTRAINVAADENLMSQVLINLATNARDAMPKGGTLTISTAAVAKNRPFSHAHGSAQPGAYALITITDTGIGMDQKTKERIFEPFFTTKEVGKGTGLGLSIVYGIIKQHNGCIDTESHFTGGTTFRIYLPLALGQANHGHPITTPAKLTPKTANHPAHVTPQSSGDRSFPSGTETILLAEDNDTVRILTRNLLRENGYRVIEALQGDDALQRFMEHADEISLLLLDVVMPKKGGWEVYDTIRKIRPEICVIFMSGYTADVFEKQLIPEVELPLMGKPIPPGDLLRALRRELDGRNSHVDTVRKATA